MREDLQEMAISRNRPVNLDLTTLRFPITAIASILHRVAGVVLFFGSFILMTFLGMSLDNEAGFADALALLDNGFVGFIVWGILAALAYHFVAGLKHLFMDMGYGDTLESGPIFAKISMASAVVLMVLAGVWVW
ncbi:MAG: succinate dehydrogenase, cytochrome b556 subunit [Pseudomonadota bacterium]|nr:succinate dehydrogenase, cytochrome b556 subunit [Pseudomonadota bacterium]